MSESKVDETEARRRLRAWIVQTAGGIREDELTDETPIIERRLIRSLRIPDLILFIEELSGRPVQPEQLRPGVFRSVDAIVANFFR